MSSWISVDVEMSGFTRAKVGESNDGAMERWSDGVMERLQNSLDSPGNSLDSPSVESIPLHERDLGNSLDSPSVESILLMERDLGNSLDSPSVESIPLMERDLVME